jgi:hypothetical protein
MALVFTSKFGLLDYWTSQIIRFLKLLSAICLLLDFRFLRFLNFRKLITKKLITEHYLIIITFLTFVSTPS